MSDKDLLNKTVGCLLKKGSTQQTSIVWDMIKKGHKIEGPEEDMVHPFLDFLISKYILQRDYSQHVSHVYRISDRNKTRLEDKTVEFIDEFLEQYYDLPTERRKE